MKFLHVSDLHMVGGNALLYGLNPQESSVPAWHTSTVIIRMRNASLSRAI